VSKSVPILNYRSSQSGYTLRRDEVRGGGDFLNNGLKHYRYRNLLCLLWFEYTNASGVILNHKHKITVLTATNYIIRFVVLPSSTYLFTRDVEGFYFHLITLKHTPHSVGLLWMRYQPVAENCT
jgi:hypothetical protein